jgi:HJR/Mrr/RecB family endonuclease
VYWLVAVVFALSVFFGYYCVGKSLTKNLVDRQNAEKLLVAGDVVRWNAFRNFDTNWRPLLSDLVLARAVLRDVNFRNVTFFKVDFSYAQLEGADFSGSRLNRVDFSDATLVRAVFDDCSFEEVKFARAVIDEISTERTRPEHVFESGIRHHETRSFSREENQRPDLIRGAEELAALTPLKFEHFVADLLSRAGYEIERGEAERRSRYDGGVDFVAVENALVGPIRLLIQVKRVANPSRTIGPEAVRALAAVRQLTDVADIVMLVTNGRFSAAAIDIASRIPGVRLLDGQRLVEMEMALTKPSASREPR